MQSMDACPFEMYASGVPKNQSPASRRSLGSFSRLTRFDSAA